MKKLILLVVTAIILLTSCGNKSDSNVCIGTDNLYYENCTYPENAADYYIRTNILIDESFFGRYHVFAVGEKVEFLPPEEKDYVKNKMLLADFLIYPFRDDKPFKLSEELKDGDFVAVVFPASEDSFLYEGSENGIYKFKEGVLVYLMEKNFEIFDYSSYSGYSVFKNNFKGDYFGKVPIVLGTWTNIKLSLLNSQNRLISGSGLDEDVLIVDSSTGEKKSIVISFMTQMKSN